MPIASPRQQTAARIQRTESYAKKVQQMFSQTVNELLALPLSKADVGAGQMFSFDAETERTQRKVEQLLRRLQSSATLVIERGIALEWEQANQAADEIIKSQFAKQALSSPYMKGWNARNLDAMRQFINRSDHGMNLSQRVWQSCRQLRDEMEVALTVSIGEGMDAGTISRRVRRYLNDPDLMFRRFRYKDADGNWQMKWKKRIADPDRPGRYKFIDYDKDSYKDQWTGRGYYKSSAMNAMRVARTETNIAYRRADHARWQGLDFVIGQRVQLSKNHPCADICDTLAGDYPKDFVFDGWHPQCFCFVTPILVDEKEMVKMNEAFLRGEDYTPKAEPITEYPQGFKDFCINNADKIRASQHRGTEPYFVRNNAEIIDDILKKEKSDTDSPIISNQDNSYASALPYKNGKEFFDSLCEIKDHQEERLKRAQGAAEYAEGSIYLAGDKQDYINSFDNIISGNYTDKDIKRMQMVVHERQHWLSEVKGVKIGDNVADYNYDKTIFEVVNELLARQEMQRIFPDRLLFLDEGNGGYIRKCYDLQRLCKRLNVDYDAFANALPTLQSHRSTDLAKLFAQFAEKPETAEWYNELISNFYASGDDFDFGLKGRDYCEKMLIKAKYIKRGDTLLPKPDAWYYEFSKWGDNYEPYRLHGSAKGASIKGSSKA